MKPSPRKRSKSVGGVKFAFPSSSPPYSPSSIKPVVDLLSLRPTPTNKAMHDALFPLLDRGIMQRMARLGPGPQASHKAASASRALEEGNATLVPADPETG
ncbi:hypothetical protein LIER_40278 [Lithospermum erythrorhizon]|uniref:Uncharacterized protein n=1 Tax=Lithospermum erythrorhizon TaxID=34254 RepID=A0AAV3QTQ4_LITER